MALKKQGKRRNNSLQGAVVRGQGAGKKFASEKAVWKLGNMTDDNFREGKKIAFRLLAVRARTVKEIERRLVEKKIDSSTIERTVRYLKDNSFINDEKCGYGWARYRIENNPIGSIKIKYELCKKGIESDVIQRILNRIKEDFDEVETAYSLARKKIKMENENHPMSAYKKSFGYLMNRGFTQEVIEEVLGKFKWK